MNYIKTIAMFFVCLGQIVYSGAPAPKNPTELPFVIVVCSYNNDQWSETTLTSLFTQNYKNFRVIIVDDCSSDNNCEVIQQCIDKYNFNDRVTFIKNEQRRRKLSNLY